MKTQPSPPSAKAVLKARLLELIKDKVLVPKAPMKAGPKK